MSRKNDPNTVRKAFVASMTPPRLEAVDRYCKARGMTRAGLVRLAVEDYMKRHPIRPAKQRPSAAMQSKEGVLAQIATWEETGKTKGVHWEWNKLQWLDVPEDWHEVRTVIEQRKRAIDAYLDAQRQLPPDQVDRIAIAGADE